MVERESTYNQDTNEHRVELTLYVDSIGHLYSHNGEGRKEAGKYSLTLAQVTEANGNGISRFSPNQPIKKD